LASEIERLKCFEPDRRQVSRKKDDSDIERRVEKRSTSHLNAEREKEEEKRLEREITTTYTILTFLLF
jgi:hypothetical protein